MLARSPLLQFWETVTGDSLIKENNLMTQLRRQLKRPTQMMTRFATNKPRSLYVKCNEKSYEIYDAKLDKSSLFMPHGE